MPLTAIAGGVDGVVVRPDDDRFSGKWGVIDPRNECFVCPTRRRGGDKPGRKNCLHALLALNHEHRVGGFDPRPVEQRERAIESARREPAAVWAVLVELLFHALRPHHHQVNLERVGVRVGVDVIGVVEVAPADGIDVSVNPDGFLGCGFRGRLLQHIA